MHKIERLQRTLAGESTDRPPVALWRHFPGDDQRPADFAETVVDWQRQYDWDFVKVTPASSFCVADYGVQDRWVGSLEGTREITKRVITKSLDWTDLRPLDPSRGAVRQNLDAMHMIREGLAAGSPGTPFLPTVFNPLAQAKYLAGTDQLIHHLRSAPERLKTGLNTLTESTLRYIDALRKTGAAGVYYAAQFGTYGSLSEAEYREFGREYDLRILEALPRDWQFNLLHIHGENPMFELFTDYPVQAVNWHSRESAPDIATAKLTWKGALCAGWGQWDALHNGTPAQIREQARNAVEQAGGRRLILSSGCVIMTTTPFANLRAARRVVEPL
jgi:uroporphyrinogen decarboxylase